MNNIPVVCARVFVLILGARERKHTYFTRTYIAQLLLLRRWRLRRTAQHSHQLTLINGRKGSKASHSPGICSVINTQSISLLPRAVDVNCLQNRSGVVRSTSVMLTTVNGTLQQHVQLRLEIDFFYTSINFTEKIKITTFSATIRLGTVELETCKTTYWLLAASASISWPSAEVVILTCLRDGEFLRCFNQPNAPPLSPQLVYTSCSSHLLLSETSTHICGVIIIRLRRSRMIFIWGYGAQYRTGDDALLFAEAKRYSPLTIPAITLFYFFDFVDPFLVTTFAL